MHKQKNNRTSLVKGKGEKCEQRVRAAVGELKVMSWKTGPAQGMEGKGKERQEEKAKQ